MLEPELSLGMPRHSPLVVYLMQGSCSTIVCSWVVKASEHDQQFSQQSSQSAHGSPPRSQLEGELGDLEVPQTSLLLPLLCARSLNRAPLIVADGDEAFGILGAAQARGCVEGTSPARQSHSRSLGSCSLRLPTDWCSLLPTPLLCSSLAMLGGRPGEPRPREELLHELVC